MGVESKFSKTGATDIQWLFNGDVQFKVPQFQRNYDWTKENAETLWNDLVDGFQESNEESSSATEYLLGPIVLVRSDNKNKKYWIIDGQQRLSTISMIFCAARDIMSDSSISWDSKILISRHEIRKMIENTSSKNNKWKLTLNDTDRELFRQIQYWEESDNAESKLKRIRKKMEKAKSHKRLVDNYLLLYKRMKCAVYTNFDDSQDLASKIKSMPADEKKKLIKKNIMSLHEFLIHVIQKNFVINIVVDDDSTAYQIFETLNYRGRQLSKSNLIKNHVLSRVQERERQRDLSNTWNNIFDDIIKQDEDDDVFIWESFRSRNHEVKALRKNLYSLVKKRINGKEDAKQYVKTLKVDAGILTEMYNPLSSTNKTTKNDFYAIKALNAKNIRVPILAAYREWYDESRADYNELVNFLVKYFFNMKVIQKTHAGKIEKKMLEIVGLIKDGASLQDIIENLQKNYDHDIFMQGFKKFMVEPSDAAARYVLRQITVNLGTDDNDVAPVDSLTLEHILPKNTNKWKQKAFFDDSERPDRKMDDFINRLGNLTLLNDSVNKEIQNDPFPNKKRKYRKSNLDINKETVCKYNKWTARTIKDREDIFADHASEIWNLDGKHHT